jgi:hypothetical protein
MEVANGFGSVLNLRRRNVREDRNEPPCPEVADEAVGPRGEFAVVTATKH